MKLIEHFLLPPELDPEEPPKSSPFSSQGAVGSEEQLAEKEEKQKGDSFNSEEVSTEKENEQTSREDEEEHNSQAEAEGKKEHTSKEDDERNSKAETDDSDQNSPRAVLEISASSSESDGGSTSSSNSETSSVVDQSISPYGTGLESHSLQWRSLIAGLIMRKKRSMSRLSTFPPPTRRSSLRVALERIRSSRKDGGEGGGGGGVAAVEIKIGSPSWRSFAYEELAAATDGFSADKLIGKGGHAEVYKGCLVDDQLVAVKRLMKKKEEEERIGDFLSELGIIAHVNHPNAAQLLGFSVEGGLHLVLQFSPHGSLASLLHGSKEGLDWKVRFKIAVGIAEGLHYLHEGCQRRIIHRDIKASNILLTEDFQPQISDFGLAKWLPDKWNHHVVFPIEGTFGYLAPEYFMHGIVNEKTDVFAFGVLLLELITGRRAVDSSRQSLVIWAKPLLDANKVKELVDPSLEESYNPNELSRALQVASMCIHHLSTSRPSMNEVVRLLRGEEGLIELIGRESKYRAARPLFDACDMDDYTCSKYLNDLHRHKQLALEQ
ncbi:receptor-like cytosolic serine/threonine-protein kinase RBK1 isoform X3 [Canna indica]|uniref:non-specific serine/threonine protein kinase n=1 Tax=Canna indica TaxID=4628 RepID=A0AAQ3L2R9_9LILI|nr:receptor-like cytosolic serine/threonine-protein kinase RBK1 isoform X3 [Canna indica]